MNVPANLKYTKSHEWVRVETDGTVTVEIRDKQLVARVVKPCFVRNGKAMI